MSRFQSRTEKMVALCLNNKAASLQENEQDTHTKELIITSVLYTTPTSLTADIATFAALGILGNTKDLCELLPVSFESLSQDCHDESEIEETPAKKRFVDHDYALRPEQDSRNTSNFQSETETEETPKRKLFDIHDFHTPSQARGPRRSILHSINVSRKQYLTQKKENVCHNHRN
ncbi:unnamed protein product [Diabrotica balteata]|uniref:Uncharacterized protein n=1 Tax=Diabrotica balteata TaxID=107213 RepID=A0A9N9T5U6_DIABA|nr:unnamed protein product [Diabrotica balteata]